MIMKIAKKRPKRVVLNNSNVLEYLFILGIDTTDLTNKLNST